MNLFDSKPVVAVPREEIIRKRKQLLEAVTALDKELDRREDPETKKWGYLGVTSRGKGFIATGYITFDTKEEAHKAYMEENPKEDDYAAWYRIHPVYV